MKCIFNLLVVVVLLFIPVVGNADCSETIVEDIMKSLIESPELWIIHNDHIYYMDSPEVINSLRYMKDPDFKDISIITIKYGIMDPIFLDIEKPKCDLPNIKKRKLTYAIRKHVFNYLGHDLGITEVDEIKDLGHSNATMEMYGVSKANRQGDREN